jgi:hypothetical protein
MQLFSCHHVCTYVQYDFIYLILATYKFTVHTFLELSVFKPRELPWQLHCKKKVSDIPAGEKNRYPLFSVGATNLASSQIFYIFAPLSCLATYVCLPSFFSHSYVFTLSQIP